MKKVLVLDFGGQDHLLVARRVRECGVYCEIKSFRMTMDEVRAFAPESHGAWEAVMGDIAQALALEATQGTAARAAG